MNKKMKHFYYLAALTIIILLNSCSKSTVTIWQDSNNNRVLFGIEKLSASLKEAGYNVKIVSKIPADSDDDIIYVGLADNKVLQNIYKDAGIDLSTPHKKESFSILSAKNNTYLSGYDPSGALYACLELSERIKEKGCIPQNICFSDSPEMILRGTAIGQQKPEILPGRKVYEYPITPENFPWFYDKELWIKYLDLLVENRFNSLYMWNGHPFASLVKLEDYPYAIEVDSATFEKNKEIFSFITHEADKRGIWVIQMFYNIIVSQPFAEHNGIETQRRSRPIDPVIADYTQKSIAAFIENYPHVGLMVCLGEAMNTIDDDVDWFTKTIIPGVKDGLTAINQEELPPIVLRGHDTDARRVMDKALPIYSNLYTTYKYNGESLTTYTPRADWVENNQALSELGSVHISNVHVLANLEPFRYGSPDFIEKSVIAMRTLYKANGLHLYPQASYWDWPYTADKVTPRQLQIDRDWIWYKAWARYAWKSVREDTAEDIYWSNQLGNYYGNKEAGSLIQKAYEESGEIAPKLARRFGISDGNRQTLLLGEFMSQLVNPTKWRIYPSFVESCGPKGERLPEYAQREFRKEGHVGETPPQIIAEVLKHGEKAQEAIDQAASLINKNKEEFKRLQNDIHCYNDIAKFFANKGKAAMLVLDYQLSGDITQLEKAVPFLEESVNNYSHLVDLTKDSYLYANSMQTDMRRIPIDGTKGENKTWEELLPHYQVEFENFKKNVAKLKEAGGNLEQQEEILKPGNITLEDKSLKLIPVKEGQKVYNDKDFKIDKMTEALSDLKMIPLNYSDQVEKGTVLKFKNEQPVKLVVGYFNGHSFKILEPPTLETNALANSRGQADIRIANALTVDGLYPVNVYTYYYEPGEHELNLNKGIALLLGIMDGKQNIVTYDAGLGLDGKKTVDWLFY